MFSIQAAHHRPKRGTIVDSEARCIYNGSQINTLKKGPERSYQFSSVPQYTILSISAKSKGNGKISQCNGNSILQTIHKKTFLFRIMIGVYLFFIYRNLCIENFFCIISHFTIRSPLLCPYFLSFSKIVLFQISLLIA